MVRGGNKSQLSNIAGSSNGRTMDSGSINLGSSPSPAARSEATQAGIELYPPIERSDAGRYRIVPVAGGHRIVPVAGRYRIVPVAGGYRIVPANKEKVMKKDN